MAPSNEEERWEYDHDVLIVGGGIVGCALACRLATNPTTAGLRVGLVEARPPIGQWRGGGGPDDSGREVKRDPRVYSLTPASVRLLEEIGVWGMSGVGDEAEEFYNMQVWDSRGPGFLRFGQESGQGGGEGVGRAGGPMGYVIEHKRVHSSLFERLRGLEEGGVREGGEGGLKLLCPAQVSGIEFSKPGPGGSQGPVRVTLQNGDGGGGSDGGQEVVTTRLIVGADGGNSKVSKLSGMPSWGWGYGQRAVVTTVRVAGPHTSTAFQRFLSSGPLAMLPLGNGTASLVWSTTPAHAESLKVKGLV